MGPSPGTPARERLAREFSVEIANPEKMDGTGYNATLRGDSVECQIANYFFTYRFINEKECEVKVVNGSSIEKTLEVPYKSDGPDWKTFFRTSCGLAQKLADSK